MIFEAGQTIRFRGKTAEARAAQAVKDAPGRVERVGKAAVRLLVGGRLILADPPKIQAFSHPE